MKTLAMTEIKKVSGGHSSSGGGYNNIAIWGGSSRWNFWVPQYQH